MSVDWIRQPTCLISTSLPLNHLSWCLKDASSSEDKNEKISITNLRLVCKEIVQARASPLAAALSQRNKILKIRKINYHAHLGRHS